jgi:hypothetical protein
MDDGSMTAILARKISKKDGKGKSKSQTIEEAIHIAMIKKAGKGDIRAAEIVHREKNREPFCEAQSKSEMEPRTLSKIIHVFESDLFTALGHFYRSIPEKSSKEQILEEATRRFGKPGLRGGKKWIEHFSIRFGLGLIDLQPQNEGRGKG